MYFATRPELEKQYVKAVDVLMSTSCRRIGVKSRGDDFEYPLWVLLHGRGDKFSMYHFKFPISTSDNNTVKRLCAFIFLGNMAKQIQEMQANNILYQSNDIAIVKKLL